MRTLAVVPIKDLSSAKQRLADALAGGARSSLVQAMFADVLGSLRRAAAVDAIVAVTSDVGAESIARGDGVLVLADSHRSGQSDATLIGISRALEEGFDRVLLVPGDTPLISPSDVDELLARGERDRVEVTIVPDRHGTGTNALVIAPPDAFRPSFGPGSHARHVEAAKAGGLSYRSIPVPSLAHDVDTPDDLAALWPAVQSSRRVAARTRGTLAQFERSGLLQRLPGLTAPGVAS